MVNNNETAKRDIPGNELTDSFWLTDESKNSTLDSDLNQVLCYPNANERTFIR